MGHDKRYKIPLSHDFSSKKWQSKKKKGNGRSRVLRVRAVMVCAALWSGLIVSRLYTLQISEVSKWRTSAVKQHHTLVELAPERGPILDRNGKRLAVSVPSGSVYVRPASVKDSQATIDSLSEILGMSKSRVEKKLQSKAPFVWVKRQVPRVQAEKVEKLGLKGVGYFLESRRYYPYNHAASALIGKVGIDGQGLSGIEAVYDGHLRGESIRLPVTRDAFGKRIEVPNTQATQDFDLPKGEHLQLTLDARLQLIVDEELEKGRQNANAQSALAVMVDASTGDILAMSQAPAMNFNADKVRSKNDLKNLVVETVFEPGSVMKPIVAAAAIESGVLREQDMIDCENGSYRFGRHIINDVHPSDTLSLRQVVIQSSNIGMTKVGMKLGSDHLYESLRTFGFGEKSKLKLPGESGGILRNVKNWANVDVATHSYGQGIAITPLQMVRAVSAIANGGYLPELRLQENGQKPAFRRILSTPAARAARDIMIGVVEDEHGTGKRAAVSGVRVGGKTGTAQRARANGRGYEPGSYVASFVGFTDGSNIGVSKNLVLYVVIDRPNTTSIYGGTLAGPVFQRIMQRSLHVLSTDRFERGDILPKESYNSGYELRPVAYRG